MFDNRLKQLRIERKLNMRQAAIQIGIPYTTYIGYEKNEREPNSETLKSLADFFNCSVDFLVGRSTDRVNDNVLDDVAILDDNALKRFGNIYDVNFWNTIDSFELSHIKKYRTLDEHGKRIVDMVLDEEFQRIQKAVTKDEESDNVIELNELFQKASAGRGTFADDETTSIHKVKLNEYTRRADVIIHVYGDSMEPEYHDGDALLVHQQPSVDIGDIGIFIHQGERYVKKYSGKALISLNKNYEDMPVDDTTICFGKVLGVLKDEWVVE